MLSVVSLAEEFACRLRLAPSWNGRKDYGFATMHVEYHQISVEYFNDEALQQQHPMSSRSASLCYVTPILFLHSHLDQGKRLWDPVVIPRIDVVQDSV